MKSRIRPGAKPASGGPRLNSQRGVPGEERLAVYAGGYLARIQEALEDMYPAVRRMAGPRRFGALAAAYAADRPSRGYNLNASGDAFPEWLDASGQAGALPFLPDLARLEQRVAYAFHARQEPPLGADALAAVTPERWAALRFGFQPSVSVVASAWPVLDLWAAREQPAGTIDLRVEGRPQRVLVSRDGLRVRCELLEPWAHALLAALLEGRTLGESVIGAAASAAQMEAAFARWASAGLIVRVHAE